MEIVLSEDVKKALPEIQKFNENCEKIKENGIKSLAFIGIKDFCKISGWSEPTVKDLFNRPDFPSSDFGKEKKAEISAVQKYFSVPRRK